MTIEWALICTGVDVVAPGVLNIRGAGTDTFGVSSLPARITFALPIKLRGAVSEFAGDHELEAHVWGPHMTMLRHLRQPVTLPTPSEVIGDEQGVSAAVTLFPDFVAHSSGTHSIEFRLDGRTQATTLFFYLVSSN